MEQMQYSAKEVLQIKGAKIYAVSFLIMTTIAAVMQMTGKLPLSKIMPTFVANMTIAVLGFYICWRLMKKKRATVFMWLAGIITITINSVVRYVYAMEYDWLYSVQSIQIIGVQLFSLIMLQYFYNKKLYMTFFVISILNWILFIILALTIGNVDMPLLGKVGGQVYHGVMINREIYIIIVFGIVSYAGYQNIPIIEEFDSTTSKQSNTIGEQMQKQQEVAGIVKEKMNELFLLVNNQNKKIGDFNMQMQTQASTFEEISATLEELQGSAENISSIAQNELEQNLTMESAVNGFKEVKVQTRSVLDKTLTGMSSVIKKTDDGKDKLAALELTLGKMKEQSGKISETTEVIIEIADKINMLSLNASIEAARAGDFGRGFAVVADEIGKLAQQTSMSIKEIELATANSNETTRDGVERIQNTSIIVKEIINEIIENSKTIEALKEHINKEESFIADISDQMQQNIELAKSIDSGTSEQKTAIESTNKAMEHMNEVLVVMVDSINSIASSSAKISDNATELLKQTTSV